MKTLKQVKNEVAFIHGSVDWNDLMSSVEDDIEAEYFIDELANEYARQVAEQVRQDCECDARVRTVERLSDVTLIGNMTFASHYLSSTIVRVDKQSILNTEIKLP